MVEMMPARAGRLIAAIVLVSLAAACSDDAPARSTATPVGPRPAERASQSPADARRDGVVPEVAALPYGARVKALSTVRIDDDTWAISRLASRGQALVGCERSPDEGRYGIDFVCGSEYGEVLKLDGRRIARAFPLPSEPPQFIAITEDAVYCARQGDGALSDSMVCRIDRRTDEWIVRLFPAPTEDAWVDGEELPTGWSVDDGELSVEKFAADDAGVWAKTRYGRWTKLDPNTLEVVERDIERVTSDEH